MTASPARENAAASPSPPVEKTWPPNRSIAARRITSWRASADRIASGAVSHDRVDPSMSVKRNVTVPDGASTTGVSHDLTGSGLDRAGKPCPRAPDVPVPGRDRTGSEDRAGVGGAAPHGTSAYPQPGGLGHRRGGDRGHAVGASATTPEGDGGRRCGAG